MGNSGLRKLIFPEDIVESPYKTINEIKVFGLDKEEVQLSVYSQDKVTLIVNMGSGNPQFQEQMSQLNALKTTNQNNIEILAFPYNQFHNEPQDFKAIERNYQDIAKFPVQQKLEVNGQYSHPLYKFLKRNSELFNIKLMNAGKISEDFSKFLVNKAGQVVGQYPKEIPFQKIQADIDSIMDLIQHQQLSQQF